ncbi:MAG: response regulator [Anaerolineae bacterium]|nr:response regulator [Anaerolineales bacterium]MCQ3972740.1 response regulator receiver protein [Anaerolineae bacterium]
MTNRIFVVDDDVVSLKLSTAVLKQAGYEVLTAQRGYEALQRIDQIRPDLLILDLNMPDMTGYEVCQKLRSNPRYTHLPILMLTGANTLEEKVKGFEAGVDDYLVKPFQPVEFQVRVKSLIRRNATAPAVAVSKSVSKVVALCSLRGGVGVSTLAIDLALSLVQIWQLPAVLLDLALMGGQDAVMLNLPLRNSWADLGKLDPAEIEIEQVQRALLAHPSGLYVLAAPHLLEQGEKVTAEHVSRVIALLKERYHYLVLDLSHNIQETTLAALDAADQILIVMTPELASVYVTARTLAMFDGLGYSRNNISLILNSTFQHHALARSDIESALKHPISLVVPFASDLLINAINTGVPVMTKAPEHPFGVLIEDFAYALSKDEHKLLQPPTPSPAWKRVTQRYQQQRSKK